MCLRPDKKKKRNKKTYSKEIEATWYALSRFISTFDYVIRYTNKDGNLQISTPNPNCVLASHNSKYGLLRPQAITKSMFIEHFNRDVIIFYKSDTNAKLTTGYGRYDKDALTLSFSAELKITTKKTTDPQYYVLLIGIDIDCHNGELHVHEVEELMKKYLPNTYWEDSTNGSGRHGYFKIKFLNSFGVLKEISNSIKKLFSQLKKLKNLYEYEAQIDDPAGLPYISELVETNPYIKNWTTLSHKPDKENKFLGRFINRKSQIWKDYISFLINNTIHRVPEKCYSRPSKLSKYLSLDDISATFSKFLSDNDISLPPPTKNKKYYKITYQRAFKLPMFGATASNSGNALPDIDCIKQFHFLPYYTSSELKDIYNLITDDIRELSSISPNDYFLHKYHISSGLIPVDITASISLSYSSHSSSPDSDLDMLSIPIPLKGEGKAPSIRSRCSLITGTFAQTTQTEKLSPIKKEQKTIGNNCACTYTQNRSKNRDVDEPEKKEEAEYAEIIRWMEIIENNNEEFEIEEFWNNYKQNRKSRGSSRYEEILKKVKAEDNTMKRTSWFVCAYINRIGRIPTVGEAEEEYVGRGLNRNSKPSTANRRKRLRGCIAYYRKKYQEGKAGFVLNWDEEKQAVVDLVKFYLPQKLSYKQGKTTRSISPEEIGFVYHVICRMDDSEQYVLLGNSLSYAQIDKFFMNEFGKKCGRHKFPGIIKILLSCKLIKKTGNYKVGLRGNCYRPKRNMGHTA